MSTAPVTLDFSKSQPVATPQASPDGGGVSLDFSKAQPLQPEQSGKAGMSAALDNPDIQDLGHGDQAAGVAADVMGTKAVVQGGLSAAKAGISALTAPTEGAAKAVGTGILDSAGKEITKDVATKGPSLLEKGIDQIREHVKDILPEGASVDQAAKIAKIIYHVGAPTAAATYLWHEIFGK